MDEKRKVLATAAETNGVAIGAGADHPGRTARLVDAGMMLFVPAAAVVLAVVATVHRLLHLKDQAA